MSFRSSSSVVVMTGEALLCRPGFLVKVAGRTEDWGCYWCLLHGFHVDLYVQLMVAPSQNYSADGSHIAVVAAPGEGDVSVGGDKIVCWVYIEPAEVRAVDGKPGVGSVGSYKAGLAGGREGSEVATDVSGGQTQGAQAGHL